MASTLRSLFRASKDRLADRAAFAQVMSRLSELRSNKDRHRDEQQAAKDEQRLPDCSGKRVFN